MRRKELEHLIRAAGAVADEDELIIIGSQAILGQFPNASNLLCQSMEADIIPVASPEKWNLIDGVLLEFTQEVVKQGMAQQERLLERLGTTELSTELRAVVMSRITRDFLA